MLRRTLLACAIAASAAAALPAGAAAEERGRWIVVLKDGSSLSPGQAAAQASAQGARVRHVYRHALRGYAASLSDTLLASLRRSAEVDYVVRDGRMRLEATQSNPPSYGLDRVDQRNLPLNQAYSYNATGAGVKAYIIDTGIRLSHSDFGGRAITGTDLIDGGAVDDCYGHGTHVAGTVGGAAYGVAKGATLVGVRIGGCTDSIVVSTAIAGIDWVTGDHGAGQPAVANMSFGGGTNTAMDDAVRRMVADGVTAVTSAGNGNLLGFAANACNSSPSRVGEALTVSSVDRNDAKVSYANIGACVDLFAPGLDIISASHTSDSGSASMSGTSMASPHVAGAAALYLQGAPSASPSQVHAAIVGNSTGGVVSNPGSGTPNRLLYTGFVTGGGGGGNAAPVASFTSSCTGRTCTFTDTSTDTDGTIASRSWDFGDGGTSTAQNPSRTYAVDGTYTVRLTVTDNGGATATTTRTVTVGGGGGDPDPSTPTLASGQTVTATNGPAGSWQYWKVQVPAGSSSLSVVLDGQACGLLGCNPDLDLYVRRSSRPTTSAYDCRPFSGSSDETCSIGSPIAAWWYIGVHNAAGGNQRQYTIRATVS